MSATNNELHFPPLFVYFAYTTMRKFYGRCNVQMFRAGSLFWERELRDLSIFAVAFDMLYHYTVLLDCILDDAR